LANPSENWGRGLGEFRSQQATHGFRELRINPVRDDHYVYKHLILIEFALMEV
jgi:hypothetical protein